LVRGSNIFGDLKCQNFYSRVAYSGVVDYLVHDGRVTSSSNVARDENVLISVYPRGRIVVKCDFLPDDMSFIIAVKKNLTKYLQIKDESKV
jgi:hypothetical protein